MVEYYKIDLGSVLLPEPGHTVKFVGFDAKGNPEVQSIPPRTPTSIEEIIFRCSGDRFKLSDMMDETIKKFNVQKVIWRHRPINFYDQVHNKLWSEATCYLIIEGETNATKL